MQCRFFEFCFTSHTVFYQLKCNTLYYNFRMLVPMLDEDNLLFFFSYYKSTVYAYLHSHYIESMIYMYLYSFNFCSLTIDITGECLRLFAFFATHQLPSIVIINHSPVIVFTFLQNIFSIRILLIPIRCLSIRPDSYRMTDFN